MKTDIEKRYALINMDNEICLAFTTQGKAEKCLVTGFRVVRTQTPIPSNYAKAWNDRKPYIADIAYIAEIAE